MLSKVSGLFPHYKATINSLKSGLRWKLVLILPLISLLFYEWKQWLLTIPQPLPQRSAVFANSDHHLWGGSYYEVSVPPTQSAQSASADYRYRLWIPKGVKTVRGLIVKQHGCGGDAATAMGLVHANDLQWQALALKHQLALLGTKLSTDYQTQNRYLDDPCNSWALIERGSEEAFLTALHKLAQNSKHLELVKIPWVLWGHSGGADWAIQMAQKYPKRTIAAVLARGGAVLISDSASSLILNAKVNPALLKLPVLFAVAEKDSHIEESIELPQQIFARYRKVGAPWAIAKEADAGHETADTRLLAIPFLDAILSARLTATDGMLRAVDVARGWLGNLTTHAIAPIKNYRGNPLESVWLPNEETARKWQAYITPPSLWQQMRYRLCSRQKLNVLLGVPHLIESCRPNKIFSTQKPSAPTDVRILKLGEKETILTWDFTPDLENGLPLFRIYRNQSLIATLQGQGHDDGDTPIHPNVVLEFRDKEAKTNATYAVSAFNDRGESVTQAAGSKN